MRKLSIEVQEDSGRPGGGHAVIRLMGLQSLPDNVTYRIRPVDTALQSTPQIAWMDSDRHPLATRITTEGAELVVGPEIVENPAFLPGTLAVIEVAKCGVRGEFLWPRIAPLIRPKRRHLISVKPQRPGSPEPISDILFGEASDASSHIELATLAPELTTALPALELAETSRDAGDAALLVAAGPAGVPAAETTDETAVKTAVKTATKTGTTPALDATAPAAAALDADIHATTGGVAAGGIAPGSPAAVAALASPAAALQRPATNVWWRRGAIAAGITGLGLLGVYARTGTATPDPNIAHGMQVAEAVSLARLVTAGVPSAPDADAARLLEQADARLHGPNAARDKAEAAGLLRRYLASTLGDERTLWALTQLGSVYAEPPAGSQPDYANARRLWELSGALGDPVAMCFVAALHEHGLGVRTDKAVALGWYRQSKHAGGCRDVDAAIERLKGKK